MPADRLLSLLMLLQSRGRMTAQELAEQLEVSERTIYRDLEALSIAGVPVYTERGPGGGCSLIEGYQTSLTGLTDTEIRALFLLQLSSPLADLGLGKALNDALYKLEATLPASSRCEAERARQRFHVDTRWWYSPPITNDCLTIVQEAVWQDRMLHLVYSEENGTHRTYLLAPYGLVAKAGTWYLVGMHAMTCQVFRVSRILSAKALPEHFKRPLDFDLSRYWMDYLFFSLSNSCCIISHSNKTSMIFLIEILANYSGYTIGTTTNYAKSTIPER